MTAEVLEAQRCACWVPTRSTEGQEASYGGEAPPWKGHHVPVKATKGKISPLLLLLLVFLLHAIYLNHIRKNLFYVFKFLLLESNLYEFLLQQGCHSGGEER